MTQKHQRPHGRDLRKGRVSLPGHVYLVTTVTWRRIPRFLDLRAARTVIHCLRNSDTAGRSRTLTYVLMPDHLHWLFQLGEECHLSQVVGGVKSVSAHGMGTRIWQPGFHDHAVRKDEDLRAMARYIVANPIRAGLVDRIGDYPHWDACWLWED